MTYAKPFLSTLDLASAAASCCVQTWAGVGVTFLCGSGLPGSQPINVPAPTDSLASLQSGG